MAALSLTVRARIFLGGSVPTATAERDDGSRGSSGTSRHGGQVTLKDRRHSPSSHPDNVRGEKKTAALGLSSIEMFGLRCRVGSRTPRAAGTRSQSTSAARVRPFVPTDFDAQATRRDAAQHNAMQCDATQHARPCRGRFRCAAPRHVWACGCLRPSSRRSAEPRFFFEIYIYISEHCRRRWPKRYDGSEGQPS